MQRFEDHWTEVEGVRVRYWQAGSEGTPVVLLHGIGCSALEWNRNLAALATRHRVFAIDLPGSGRSGFLPGGPATVQRLAASVLGLIQALGLGAVHLGGNSLGGRVALECAIAQPAAVRSLLLVAPAGIGRETLLNFRLASVPGLGELLTRPSKAGLSMLWRLACFDTSSIERERLEEKLADARRPGAQAAFLGTLRSLLGWRGFHPQTLQRLHGQLPQVRQPALVVWGKNDRLLPVAHAELLRALLPSARVELLDACGHVPQIEHADHVNTLMLEFLDKVDQAKSA